MSERPPGRQSYKAVTPFNQVDLKRSPGASETYMYEQSERETRTSQYIHFAAVQLISFHIRGSATIMTRRIIPYATASTSNSVSGDGIEAIGGNTTSQSAVTSQACESERRSPISGCVTHTLQTPTGSSQQSSPDGTDLSRDVRELTTQDLKMKLNKTCQTGTSAKVWNSTILPSRR